jgi:hypothetical protein
VLNTISILRSPQLGSGAPSVIIEKQAWLPAVEPGPNRRIFARVGFWQENEECLSITKQREDSESGSVAVAMIWHPV